MAAKNESIHPPRNPSHAHTSGASVPGVTGRTPEVPERAEGAVEVTLRPFDEQVSEAGHVAQELDTASYRDDFSAHAPDRATVVAQLTRAKALSDEAARADAWAAHLKAESDRAWQAALATMAQLQGHFEAADASSPNVALRYPKTRAFFAVRAKAAVRAAVTRRKNRAAKKPATPA